MAYAVRIQIDDHADAAVGSAVEWIRGFYPDVAISLDGEAVLLASGSLPEVKLRLIWLTTLTNERLLTRNAARRAAVLGELLR